MYNDFDIVFLAGGTNRIPILQEIVKKKFPKAKIIIDGQVEIITATGAAIHGLQILNGEIEPFSNFERFRAVEQESTVTMTKSENLKPNIFKYPTNNKEKAQFLPENLENPNLKK
uniref:Heat shock protein 70 n=1 Tax=Panagrolaimus sp. JU765 TaxID=591449 RepID=A0AC34RDX4_9BILA